MGPQHSRMLREEKSGKREKKRGKRWQQKGYNH